MISFAHQGKNKSNKNDIDSNLPDDSTLCHSKKLHYLKTTGFEFCIF